MAGQIKGITIEFDGNTTKLDNAIKSVNKNTRALDSELRKINSALKFNPTSVDLWKQKQQVLTQKIGETEKKLDALKQAQKQMDADGVDKNSKEYRELQREIIETESKLKTFNTELKKVGNANLRALSEGFKQAGEKLEAAGQAMLPFSVAGAAVAGSIGTIAYKSGLAADDLNTLSKVTGVGTKELQKYGLAADLVDVSTEAIAKSQKKLTKSAYDAANGSKSQAEAFEALGVSVTDADGNLKDSEQIFDEVIASLGSMENETERNALAQKIMGKAAAELNPLIADGGETYKNVSETLKKYNLDYVDQETLDKANEFNDSLDTMKLIGKVAIAQVGSQLAGYLAPALEKVVEWVGKFAEWVSKLDPALLSIIAVIGGVVAAIAPVLIGLGKLSLAISSIMSLASKIGPLFKGMGALFNPWVLGIAAAVAAGILIYKNWDKIKAAAQKLWAKIKPIFEKMGTFIKTTWDKTKTAVKTAWDGIKTAISNAVDAIKNTISKVFNAIKAFIIAVLKVYVSTFRAQFVLIKTAVTTAVNAVKTVITTVFNAIKTFLTAVLKAYVAVIKAEWQIIKTVVTTTVNAIKTVITTVFNAIKTFITTVWNAIKTAITNAINATKTTVSTAVDAIKTKVTTVFNAVKTTVTTVWNAIKTAITTAIDAAKTKVATVVDAIKTKVSTVFDSIKTKVTTVWNAIKTAITTAIDTAKTTVATVVDAIKTKVATVFDSIKTKVSTVWNAIKTAITSPIEKAKSTVATVVDAIKTKVSNAFDGISTKVKAAFDKVKTAITDPIDKAKTTLSGIIDKIKGFFPIKIGNLMSNIKLPHFSLKWGSKDFGKLGTISYPTGLNVDWWAKGGIFTRPTIFATPSGMQGVGEAGAEAVLPLDVLWNNMTNMGETIVAGVTANQQRQDQLLAQLVQLNALMLEQMRKDKDFRIDGRVAGRIINDLVKV